MSDFKIDKNMPIPESRTISKYPYAQLQIGDSFFVEGKRIAGLSQSRWLAQKQHKIKLKARSVTENEVAGVRIWRVG